jgi:site-specific DNA-cytosine methylase
MNQPLLESNTPEWTSDDWQTPDSIAIAALGNAVVPQVAAKVFQRLKEILN